MFRRSREFFDETQPPLDCRVKVVEIENCVEVHKS